MKRESVQRSYHNGTRGLPMLNVKVHRDIRRDAIEASPPVAGATFREWLASVASDDEWRRGYEIAQEISWERAQDAATGRFGSSAKVYSAGRSGGWLIVDGLRDVDSWDAIDLGKWAGFAADVRSLVSDLGYLTADAMFYNVAPSEYQEPQHAIG